MDAVETTPGHHEGILPSVNDLREARKLGGREKKQRKARVKHESSLFYGSHVGTREQAALDRVEAVASCVQMEVLERHLLASDDIVNHNRNKECESSGDREPYQTVRELNLSSSEADPEKGALELHAAAAARESVSDEKMVGKKLLQKKLRLPFSDMFISLVTWNRRNVFPGESTRLTSSFSSANSTQKSLFKNLTPQSCMSYTLTLVDRWHPKKPVAFAAVRAQLLRELASRIRVASGLDVDPFDMTPPIEEAARHQQDLDEARTLLANDAEVQRLLTLYGRLLQFDANVLLPGSQWWRFQRGYSTEEHSPFQLPFYPCSTLLQRIRKLKGIKSLRPPLHYAQVQPHLKLTVDIMHVCLTDHYLFGSEDVLAQDVMRLYEVYCFLSNYKSGEQLTTRLRSAILYSEEVRQRLGVYTPMALYAIARGESPTEAMKQELRHAEQVLVQWKQSQPQQWQNWLQHLKQRRQLRLQRDGEALLFSRCESDIESKWQELIQVRRRHGFSQTNLEMNVALIQTNAEEDALTLQKEIFAEAEEVFFYHIDTACSGGKSVQQVLSRAGDGGSSDQSGSLRAGNSEWRFNLEELVEAISLKFEKQRRRRPGEPLRRLMLTQSNKQRDDKLSLPISESLRRMLASSLLCTISCKINGQLLPRRAHIPLKVPTFSSAANHLLPSIWDYEDNEDEGGPGHKTHGAMDGERTEFSFGILLTEGLEELSFDVELQHAECSAPVKTTASVPISPELSCFTRPPTLSPVLESKELFPLTENYISSSAALASPVSIYVDVPFSSRRAALNCDTHRTKQPLDHSAVPVEFVFQPTPPAEPMGVPLGSSPYGTLSNNGVPCHVSRSLSEGRSHPHLLRVPSTFGPSSRRGSFLFQETELRLAVPSWDEEMASAAQEEAAAVAAAMAAEIEQEAYQAAAVVAAAAEAARQIAIPEEPTKFAWHTHRNQHVPNVAVAGDPGARTSVRGSHGKKLFDRRPLFTRQQGREHGTGASGSPAATEQHALVAAAEEQSLSSGDTHSRAAAEGRVGGAVEKPSRTLKKLEEEQVATPEVSVSPHPSAECRRPSPPTFAANASHTSPPNDSEVVPQQQLAGHHEATVVRHQLMGSGVPSYSQSCSPPRLPQPIYSPGATDPALPFRPPRPHIVASSASGAPLPTPAVVVSRPKATAWYSHPRETLGDSAGYNVSWQRTGGRAVSDKAYRLLPFPAPDWSSPSSKNGVPELPGPAEQHAGILQGTETSRLSRLTDASGSIHQMPARSRRLLSFTRVSRPEDTDEASKLRIPLSHLFIKSNDTTGGSWQIGDERTFVLPGKAEQEGSSRRNHRSISALYSRLTSRSRTSEQLSVGVGPTPGYHPFGSEDTAPLTKGGLKLRVTLEPVPPGERAAEALLEGYEALVLRRQQLRAAVDGDPSLVTLYRHLPTTPGDLYAANRAEERAYAASAAAAAVAAMPAPEAAYHSGALQPRSSSTHTKRVVLLRDKKRQDVLDTRLGRSRPLTACVRLLILLQRCGALVPESQGPMLPLLAASTAAFVAPATVERLLKERGLEVPGLDAEVVALLQSMQKTVDAKSRFKQKISTVEERNILRDAEEEDDDEDELEEDDAAEDIYTRFLREFLNSALPVQVAAVLKSSSRVDFPAVVSEVVPRLNIHLLFQQIKACCCTHRLLGFTRYVEAKAARRRVTVIDPVDDRSIGIFVKVRRLYNVPLRREPRDLVKWHHRHRVGDISSASLDSPADFYLYSPRTHLQYSAQSRSRSTGATPFTFIGSNHTAYAEALQLSNPVVEVKYVNRTRGIHVAVTTKAVSGENPMINQLVHLTLPKVSKETEALMDLTKQDSYLILNVFDHHQRDVPPARRFLGSITLPWSLIIGYGLEDCFWTPSQGEEYGKHEQQGSSWRSARGHRFRIRRRRKEGPHGPITLCVIRGCLRLTQPACLPGYQRPTLINTATRCKSLDRGKQTNTFLGTNDSNSRIGSSSRSSSGVMDASKKAVNLLQEPLSMYISLSLYITGVPLRAARRSVASGRHHPIHIWCQAQDSIAACRSSAGSSLSTSSNGAMSPGEQRILGGDNQCEARGDSASATDHPVAREGEKLIIREEHWRNHCRRRGVWNPCSAFGLDLSGSLFLLCRLVAPLLPPPEVATPRSPRCFERIAAFISLFPVVDDRLLLSMHAGDRIWMTAQEQVDVGCGDSRGHALLLCCFFSAFDLMLQTQCTNYVARARICDKGVQYVVLRQASDGSVQVWDPLEPRCVFLPSAAFRKRSRKQAQKRSCGGGERGDSILSDQWSSRPLQALTSLQQQELIQQNALLREQQNDQVAMLRVRHAGLLEGSHDKFLKQFSKDISNKDLQNIRNPSPVFPCTDGTAGQEGVQVISTCQEQLGPIHHSVQNTPFFPPEQSSCSSVWDGVTVNHDLPFPIGGTCSNQEKGVLPIEGIDLVFNNENALTNLQSMECVSSSSNGATRHHSAGERWEPLTGGCSVPESDRKLRDKIRRKLLRRKKKKCCGLIYACRLLKDFISRLFTVNFWLRAAASCLSCLCCDKRLKPPPKAVNLFDMSFDFSNKSKWSALLPSLQNLRSLSDPSALAAATEAFRDCLLQKNDGASAAEAAALALGATSPDALLRISLFPPVGLITPMVQALRYRTADFACARALEARLQRHIEAHIKALYRRDRSLSSDGSGRTSVNTVSTVRDSSSFDGRGASTAPLSRPRQSVFFSRDAATEIYRLLKHFETARMCMAWQQPISPDERRSHRESIFPETTTGAKCGSQPNKESCAQSHIFPSSPTGEARNAQGEDWSSCCPSDLESRLQDCLRKYYKERETPYAVPLHFSRMDKHFVWQLLENTGVFAPVPQKAAFAHTQLAGLGGAREELCRSRQCLRPLGATVAVVVRVFAYPCGVYSGWVCAARLD